MSNETITVNISQGDFEMSFLSEPAELGDRMKLALKQWSVYQYHAMDVIWDSFKVGKP